MDTRLIIQVIINLIDNAIKYTPKGSHILIHIFKQKHEVCIDVQAVSYTHLDVYKRQDISSGVETNGYKDKEKIKRIVRKVKYGNR